MRGKISAGVVMALALLVPAAPAAAVAKAAAPGLDAACQTVERKPFKDIRELIKIDLDTAGDTDVRVLTGQILTVARNESLPVLPKALQDRLDGTPEDLRAFLKKGVLQAWTVDLRVSATRTLVNAGPNVKKAATVALDNGTIEVFLAYLNDGLYAARELDCAAQPTPTPTVTPTATPSVTPSATTTAAPTATATTSPAAPGGETGEGGEGGGLPVTGTDTTIVAGLGAALLLAGGAIFLIGRRRKARFTA